MENLINQIINTRNKNLKREFFSFSITEPSKTFVVKFIEKLNAQTNKKFESLFIDFLNLHDSLDLIIPVLNNDKTIQLLVSNIFPESNSKTDGILFISNYSIGHTYIKEIFKRIIFNELNSKYKFPKNWHIIEIL